MAAYRARAPKKTGNLAYNAINYEYTTAGNLSATLYVDDEIAPYVYYTEEPWISPRWHGKKNPNEGWIEDGVLKIAEAIAEALGGTVIEDDTLL